MEGVIERSVVSVKEVTKKAAVDSSDIATRTMAENRYNLIMGAAFTK